MLLLLLLLCCSTVLVIIYWPCLIHRYCIIRSRKVVTCSMWSPIRKKNAESYARTKYPPALWIREQNQKQLASPRPSKTHQPMLMRSDEFDTRFAWLELSLVSHFLLPAGSKKDLLILKRHLLGTQEKKKQKTENRIVYCSCCIDFSNRVCTTYSISYTQG